jgi:hypothetical protein
MTDGFSHLCRACGKNMKPDFAPYEEFPWHPLCAPLDAKVPGTDETYGDLELREALTDVIKWASNNSTRSQQVQLGCSEVGDPCERKIGMTMAGLEQTNFSADPWPSIVGTSIHTWLEAAIEKYQKVHGRIEWLTELEVWPSEWLPGHTDLYHRPTQTVLDLKNPSRTNFRKMKKDGFGSTYEVQFHLYGEGNRKAGRPVKRVGVVMLPRDGNLGEMLVRTYPFSPQIVADAFAKVERIADMLVELDVVNKPANWSKVPHEPGFLCGWCPFYRPGNRKAADATGCPGKYSDDPIQDLFC